MVKPFFLFLLATSKNALQVVQKHLQAPCGVCFSHKLFHLQLQQKSDKTLNKSSKGNKARVSSCYHNPPPTHHNISFHNKNTRQKQNANIHFDARDLLDRPNKDVAALFSIQLEKQLFKKKTFLLSN